MTGEAWDQLPPGSRPDCWPAEDGPSVYFELVDAEVARAPVPPETAPDLRGVSSHGVIHGEQATMVFVTSADRDLIPADRRPAELEERTGAWYAVFSLDSGGLLR